MVNPRKEVERPIGYAVVGLGWVAQQAMLPGFRNARNSKLVALVSGDETKLSELTKRYKGARAYSYDRYDDCLASDDVDAVYLAVPNQLHREYAERAARAGVHVLCEKPMAVTAADCESMIRVAREHDVKLMVAYRLHFNDAHLEAIDLCQRGGLGELRLFASVFTQNVKEGNSRLKAKNAAAPLPDMGIYCINMARAFFQSEPEEAFAVHATRSDPRFSEVPEMSSVILRFPGDRLATFTCSYGTAMGSSYRVVGTTGMIRMEPAYQFNAEPKMEIDLQGQKGPPQVRNFSRHDQFGSQLIYFSDCILHDREPEPSGDEGLADIRVLEALEQSAREGRPIRLEPFTKQTRPTSALRIDLPAVPAPPLVNAQAI
jgi:glucose-fructose oxidoreductase